LLVDDQLLTERQAIAVAARLILKLYSREKGARLVFDGAIRIPSDAVRLWSSHPTFSTDVARHGIAGAWLTACFALVAGCSY